MSRVQAGVELQIFFAAEKDHETKLPSSGRRWVLLLLTVRKSSTEIHATKHTPSFKKKHLQSIRS